MGQPGTAFAPSFSMKLTTSLLALSALSLCAVACSAEDVAAADFAEGSATNSGDSTKTPGDLGDKTPPPKPGEFEGCASSTLKGASTPVHMVIALDVSGSMCEPVEGGGGSCGSPTSKWSQTKAAFGAFFADANSKDAFASVIPWAGNNCSGFNTPRGTADVRLPDTGGSLLSSLNTINPNGGTPTVAAINGALQYAQSLKSTLTDGGKVVIVLATDGQPTACGSVSQAASAAGAAFTAGFPVYVVGVGPSLNNLNEIAAGAQTNGGKAILVTKDVNTELNKALADIKGKSLGCGLQLPVATSGQSLDFSKVNLTFTDNGGVTKTMPKSQDCSNADGWKYVPNESAPTGIELCTAACGTVKVADKGSIGVVLGCATKTNAN
jgi:hypothetical protein